MKSKLVVLSIVVLIFSVGQVYAEGEHDHGDHSEVDSKEDKGSMMEELHSEAPNVGNAICPVSGEFISEVGDGKGVQIEHEGKIYNVCCTFCAKDFKKDPEKFIKIIEDNLAEGTDPGRDYESDHDDAKQDESDHDEEAEHEHGGSHEHGDGDHDN